jgi:lipopolysaccharide transport system ATP-binding protein
MQSVVASTPTAQREHAVDMAPVRVRLESVVQRFRLIKERPDTLRESFPHLFRRRSDVIIGRNGSGKSTLLKVIAGIYKPTSGVAHVNGRVAALIELGAGFHHELTGRENIVINGLLHGLSRRQIRSREKQIIEFADLGPFIDSPVKQYSTGMYMRLAFAVAMEVDADILLVDEVLAVGDQSFREKCVSRMIDLRRQGKTIILVSHDMIAVRSLCSRAILFHAGELQADGLPQLVVERYLQPEVGAKADVV